MAEAIRSQNADLAEGMSDGKYKKVVTDRGGRVEPTTYAERAQLHDLYYGIHEARTKILPDATTHTTPDFAVTPGANPWG